MPVVSGIQSANPYDDLLVDDSRQQLRSSLNEASTENPDTYAKAKQLGERVGLPVRAVAPVMPEVEQRAKVTTYDDLLDSAPGTARFLSNPENAKLSHDHIDNLSTFEKIVRYPWQGVKAVASAIPATAAGFYGLLAAPFDLASDVIGKPLTAARILPEDIFGRVGAGFRSASQMESSFAKRVADVPPDAGLVHQGVVSGLQSFGQNVPWMAAGLMSGNPSIALGGMSALVGGTSYVKAREAGLPAGSAVVFAGRDAGIEAATEGFAFGRLLRDVKAGAPFLKLFLQNQLREQLGEQAATHLQDFNEWATLNPEKPFGTYLDSRGDAAIQTAIATAVAGGGHTAVAKVIQHQAGYAAKAQRAAQDAEQIAAIVKASTDIKLRERDPQTFTAFVAEATKGGPLEAVYVDAVTFAQGAQEAGIDIARTMPETAAALSAAMATGSDVRIPVSEFAAAVPGTTFEQGIIPELRTAPEAPTAREAGDAAWVKETERITEKILAEQDQTETWRQSAKVVEDKLLADLNTAKRFKPEVNRAYAGFMSAFYSTQAHRLGITPDAMFQRYPVRVQATGVAGAGVLEQGDNRRLALRDLHKERGVKFTDHSIDRGGAHSPAGPDGGSPAFDVALNGTYPEDFYSSVGLRYYGTGNPSMDSQSYETLRRVAGRPNSLVTVYRAVDANGPKKLVAGDWVTTVRAYAKEHGDSNISGGYKIIKQTVHARDIWTSGDSMLEWGYHPQEFLPEVKLRDGGQYSQSGTTPRAQIAFPETGVGTDAAIITLFKGADLSSFLHESGHLYLEVLTDLASQPDAPAGIASDMQALLKWFGIEDMNQWNALTLDEKRPYHEQFARGMEAYLFDGKSPNVEMQSLFQRFRAWMLNVYKQLKALNVDLTPEVRGVMDRLLATNDQIVAAEEARNMEPLFATKPDGMSDAEWLDYQALGAAPTQEAVEELQARSLRDMKWLSNAKAKVIRDLQRQANDQRRAVRIEARREILSQPIYQAWQFLTGEVEKSDKPARKPSAGLDPAVDSLLVAIGKIGGLDTAEAVRRWGIDPSEVKGLERGGKKAVLRRKGGKDIDTVMEELAQYGYFDLDQNGKADERQFEDKFRAERGGDLQYSNAADFDTINSGRYGLEQEAAALTDEPAGKLDTTELKKRYGDAPDAPWRRLVNLGMTSEKNGIHPDIIAEAMNARNSAGEGGFSSGDEMVSRLIEIPAPRDAINALTDQMMLERYGDMVDPVAIQRAAEAAIHNEARARLVATELRMAEKANSATADTGRMDSRGRPIRQSILTTAARDFAARLIAGKKLRDIRPAAYSAAAARAGAAAQRALGGDVAEVAAQKRNQLINTFAAKAASDAITEIERDVGYFKRVENSKAIDPEYREQIHALLERYDLRQVTNREAARRQSLADWIKAQEKLGLEPVIDEAILADIERKPYREMTLEELRGLYDAVRNIEHLGRLKHKLLTAKDARDFAEVVAGVKQSIVDNAKQTLPERRASDRGPLVTMGRLFRSAKAIHRKFSSLVRQFDGYKDGGYAWETLVQTMNERGAYEADETLKATKALSDILGPLVTGGREFTRRRHYATANKSFSREEIIGIALNMGNQTNVERVLTGEQLTPTQLDTLLRTLSKSDWDAIQKAWDYLDSFWTEIAAKEKRVTGVEPTRVERSPVTTQFGQYPGGYYPIAYDPVRSERSSADINSEVQRQLQNGLYARAQTARGHTKARTESTGRPLRLDFGEVLTRHVTQVIHDLAWHEYLIDANRILASNTIETAVKEHYGVEVLTELKDMMRDIAIGDLGTEKGAAFFNHIRHGTTIASLGFNMFNALQNLTGITQSVSRIGTQWVFKGAAHWLGDAANFESGVQKMHDLSPQMRLRAQTINREINDIRNKIEGKDSKIVAAYFWLTIKTQLIVDTPTWWGAYEKAMAQDGITEAQAIARADQAVLDAQGGGQIKDLASIQRGGSGLKLFTTFYSYFSTTFNNMVEAYGRTNFRKPKDVALFTADMALLWTIPALLSTLLMAALKGDWDDEEKLTKKILGDQISYLMGTVVGLREMAAGAQAATGTGAGFGYTGPASVRFFSDVYKLGQQTNQVFSNGTDALDEAFWKSLNSVLGTVFHYPAGQINRTVDGIVTMSEGKTSNPGALLVGSEQK